MTRVSILILALMCVVTFFTVISETDAKEMHLEIELPSEWDEIGTGYSDIAGTAFTHKSGAMIIIIKMNTDFVMGDEIFRDYYNTELWPLILKATMPSLLGLYECSGEIIYEKKNEGIYYCAAETQYMSKPCIMAIVQYENDFWFILSLAGVRHSENDVFSEICDSILLSESNSNSSDKIETPLNNDSVEEYYIQDVPAIVHLNDNELNIYSKDTPENGLTMQRTKDVTKANMDWYVTSIGAQLVICYADTSLRDFNIQIRVKDEKYKDWPSWDQISESLLSLTMNLIYGDGITDYYVYKTKTATFTVFKMLTEGESLRYATIKNGDMIYVHMRRQNGTLTDRDYDLLKMVVDAIEFIPQ